MIAVLVGTAVWSIAILAAASDTVISPAQEVALALEIRDRFVQEYDLLPDGDPRVRAVRRLGREVAAFSDRPDLPYAFFVVESGDSPSELQAISFPGGTVALTRALVELLRRSDDELAFALAHEVAHVALRHHLSPAGDLGRHHELEADRYGALYAVRAGFRFSAALDALDRLATARRDVAEAGDHPAYAERLDDLERFREELVRSVDAFTVGLDAVRRGAVDDALAALSLFVQQFPHSVEGRVNLGTACLVKLTNDSGSPGNLEEPLPLFDKPGVHVRGVYDGELVERAHRSFRQALAVHPFSREALIGLALTVLRTGDTALADSLLARAGELGSETPELVLALGNVRFLSDEPGQALELYRKALVQREGWVAARKNLALAYEALGRNDRAAELWQRLTDEPRLGEQARWQLALLRREP